MATFTLRLACGTAVFFAAIASYGQTNSSAVAEDNSDLQTSAAAPSDPRTKSETTPIKLAQAPTGTAPVAQARPASSSAASPSSAPTGTTTTMPTTAAGTSPTTETAGNASNVLQFENEDIGVALRTLAQQEHLNLIVSDKIPEKTTVTMRLEGMTPRRAIDVIAQSKGLFVDEVNGVYYVKTPEERAKEPTESDSYQFSYSRAKDVAPLLDSQLSSKDKTQVDERTNTIFYREVRSNIDNVRKLLVTIDRPTKQVMIEARLVEVTANPKQSYGINWAGVVGSATSPQTITYGGSSSSSSTSTTGGGNIPRTDLNLGNANNHNLLGNFSKLALGQFAILTVPQMSLTLRLLNEDADAEFLANPRIVTADNQPAKIEVTRNQPVPQLNFNEQTATAVFGGFQDKKFGNTLTVRPSVNKDGFVTLSVKPEISNKVGDQPFVFAGATVTSPIIDTRSLDSNVLIRTGDTLAIGGLLQDEQTKARSKVPLLGDVPVLGYLFQERLNARTKRNLLVFVTPTIIDSKYGTGLEDQVSGLHHVGEEYADPNGWRNNAKGAVRLVPTGDRQLVADYPKPGAAPPPATTGNDVRFKSSAKDRDF